MRSVTCVEMLLQFADFSCQRFILCCLASVLTTTCRQQTILLKDVNYRTLIRFNGLRNVTHFFQIQKDTQILYKESEKETAVW